MTKGHKIRIGLFVVTTGVLLAIVLFVFGGLRFWEGRDKYTVQFDGSVMGLQHGAQVFLNGIRVGSVEDIDIAPDNLGKVDVTISIKSGTPIRSDTRAMLQMAGITGLKVIDLRGGSLAAEPLEPGSAILQGDTVLDQLEKQAKVLVDQSSQLIARANTVIDNLAVVTDPKQFEAMATIMEQAKIASRNLATATRGLDAMVASAGQSAKSAQVVIDGQVTLLLTNANDLVSQLKGVVHDNGDALRSAMLDLRQASRSFKELSREVRQKPSRLLFGGSPGERKLP